MQFILIFVWIALAAVFIRRFCTHQELMLLGVKQEKYSYIVAIAVFLPIIIMATFRGVSFGDSQTYANTYLNMPGTLDYAKIIVTSYRKDVGYYVLVNILKFIIGNNTELYFFSLALFQGCAVAYLFNKYSGKYCFSIFLFLASTDYLSWMYNGVRQFTAVSIVLFATPFIINKKYIRATVMILLASLFHQTALIVIPIMFIAKGEAFNRRTILFVIFMVISIAFIGSFTSILDDILGNTQYNEIIGNYTRANDDGTNALRVFVYSVPTMLAFFLRTKIVEADDRVIDFCVNASLISTMLYVFSMFTSGIYFGRLPIYVSLYSYILLPLEIELLVNKRSTRIMYGITIVLYLIFYYYQTHIIWGII